MNRRNFLKLAGVGFIPIKWKARDEDIKITGGVVSTGQPGVEVLGGISGGFDYEVTVNGRDLSKYCCEFALTEEIEKSRQFKITLLNLPNYRHDITHEIAIYNTKTQISHSFAAQLLKTEMLAEVQEINRFQATFTVIGPIAVIYHGGSLDRHN